MGERMKFRHRVATCLAICLSCFPMLAGASFFMIGEGRYATLTKEVSYRVDPGAGLGIDEVMRLESGWDSQASKPFRAGAGPVVLWARFDPPAPTGGTRILVTSPPWEHVDYFVVRDGRVEGRQRAGLLVPWAERTTHVTMTPSILHSGFVAIDVPAGIRTTVYARLQTEHRYFTVERLRFSLWNAALVLEAEKHDRIVQGVFFGLMLFLLVYNFGLLVATRESSYFYYVVMETGFTAVWGVIFGLTFEMLWPGHPAWDYHAMWIATALGGFGASQFLRHYLDAPRLFPRIDFLLKWSARLDLALVPVTFLPIKWETTGPLLLYSAPLGAALMLFVMIHALRSRHPLAPNLLLALSCLSGGVLTYVATELDLVPSTDVTIHAGQIGSALMGIILSVGLAMRFQRMRIQLAERELAHEREKREIIEDQNRILEGKVVERTTQLTASQAQSDALLANILPQAIIQELREKGETEPRRHEEASILFTDFSGFTQAVSTMPPRRLVQELNEIFRGFDDIVAGQGLEKIKTIGDAYMAAGGLPVSAADHAVRCVRAGLALTRFIEERNRTAAMKWGLRVGVHSGAVVAGVVGKNKYAYDVWGDTVNIASRLESTGEVNKVNISAYTYELVRDHFECEYRGKVTAKGKGEIDMYFVVSERAAPALTGNS
jgi:class 3 adenylate cyclase